MHFHYPSPQPTMLDVGDPKLPGFCSPFSTVNVASRPTKETEEHVFVPMKKPLQKADGNVVPQEMKKVVGKRRRKGRGNSNGTASSENRVLSANADFDLGHPLPVSSKSIVFPRRPGFGKAGTKCIVKANHFLAQLPDKDMNHYDVRVSTLTHNCVHFGRFPFSF